MAISGKFSVLMEDVFPHGAYVVSEVEPVRDFDKSTRERLVQAVDRESGLLLWAVSVLDADPLTRRGEKTVTVKVAAAHQPVPPESVPGMPFRPVAFEGLSVTPYVKESGGGRAQVAYSIRATGMRAPGKPAAKPGGGVQAA